MKTSGTTLLLMLAALIIPCAALSVEKVEEKYITGIIVEMSQTGDFIQVGKYSISDIQAVKIIGIGAEERDGDTTDLFAGALVQAVLTERNEKRIWKASTVTVFLGDAQNIAIEKLDPHQGAKLKRMQKRIAGRKDENSIQEDDGGGPEPQPYHGDMRKENGVWVN